MRIAVIGLGSIGTRHVTNLRALGCEVDGFDLNDVAPHPQTMQWAAYQAVVIATPYDTHLHYVEEAIRRGVACFVEKPLGSLDQLPRWREIAAMVLPVNQVGYMLRFQPHAHALKMGVSSQPVLGGGFYVHCDMRKWPGGCYGPALLECSHEIDLAMWISGACKVTSALETDIVLDDRIAIGIYPDGNRYRRRWFIQTKRFDGGVTFRAPEQLGTEMYVDEMRHFLDCVRTNTPTICPLSDGLNVLEVCAQVEQMTKANA